LVERGEPFPQDDRRVEEGIDHARAKLHPRGQRGGVGQRFERIEDVGVISWQRLRRYTRCHADRACWAQEPIEGPERVEADRLRLARDQRDILAHGALAVLRQRHADPHSSSLL